MPDCSNELIRCNAMAFAVSIDGQRDFRGSRILPRLEVRATGDVQLMHPRVSDCQSLDHLKELARRVGLEPPTLRFEACAPVLENPVISGNCKIDGSVESPLSALAALTVALRIPDGRW